MLVVQLERKFLHIHPALQNMFYELPNILDRKAKKIATIILMREFDYIVQEAREIFAYYNMNFEHPIIEEIIYDKETLRGFESKDYVAFNNNLWKRVPYPEIIQALSIDAYNRFDWVTKGIDAGFNKEWVEEMSRGPIKGEICVSYEDVYGDDPAYEIINIKITNRSPFHTLSSTARREEHDKRELLRKVLEDLIRKELNTKDDNT